MNKGLKTVVQVMFVIFLIGVVQLLFHPFSFTSTEQKSSSLPPVESEDTSRSDLQQPRQPSPSKGVDKSIKELNAEYRQQILQKRRESDALEARKREAFLKWWHAPQWCLEENSMKVLVQCSDLKRIKRIEFDALLAKGKVTLPPATDSASVSP